MSMHAIEINRNLLVIVGFLILAAVAAWYMHFYKQNSARNLQVNIDKGYIRKTQKGTGTWYILSQQVNLPKVNVADVSLREDNEKISFENKEITVYTLRSTAVVQSKGDLLLLHGASFTSQTWNGDKEPSLLTIKYMVSLGYNAVAIDLPGFGKSPAASITNRGAFIAQIIKILSLVKPVIVSPSMSGIFSLPFVLHNQDACGGFVPIAPVQTSQWSDEQYSTLKVPTLVIYGEWDTSASGSTKKLAKIPNSEVFMLTQSYHPAYLNQPAAFHHLLYNFLLSVKL